MKTAFHDLPARAFPLRIEFIAMASDVVVCTIDVPGPGAVKIPGLSVFHGPVRVRVTMADGGVSEVGPP